MLEKDKEIMRSLIKEYSIREILLSLHDAYVEEANNLSDLGLKEKAIWSHEIADILYDVSLVYNK